MSGCPARAAHKTGGKKGNVFNQFEVTLGRNPDGGGRGGVHCCSFIVCKMSLVAQVKRHYDAATTARSHGRTAI